MKAIIPDWATEPMPLWQRERRQQAYQNFLEAGFPTRHQENWKYTDLNVLLAKVFKPAQVKNQRTVSADFIAKHRLSVPSQLLVFIDGEFSPDYSDMTKLNDSITISSINQEQVPAGIYQKVYANQFDAKEFPFANLNAIFAEKILMIQVAENSPVDLPVHLLFITTQDNVVYHPQTLIYLNKQARLTIFEEHCALTQVAYLANVVNYIYTCEYAQLNYHKLQTDSLDGFRFTYSRVFQENNSHVNLDNFSRGGELVRDDIVFNLNATGATCSTSGLTLLDHDQQLIDHHIHVNHYAPYSRSEMLYKSILNQKSKSVFNGRLHVAPNAQKITAYQANHNLLLSDSAEVYTKPELEIYADDVKCKHGATTGQLNDEALFYMRARGISKGAATQILLEGFADEVLQKIRHVEIKDYIKGRLS